MKQRVRTTLAGKLALWLRQQGYSPLLVAADLQRPNAVNQLQVVGERAGIHVFAPDAACLGVILLPEPVANFCFGDDDLQSLYVTASTSLYRVRVATPGTAQWQC